VRREKNTGKSEENPGGKQRGFPLVISRICLGKDLDCCG